MVAALLVVMLTSADGYVPVRSEWFGNYTVYHEDSMRSFPIHQRVRVIDATGRIVWEHAGRSERSYEDFYSVPDFDGDGQPEVVIIERDYSATGESQRISVHSLGKQARNLLVLESHTYGRLEDVDYLVETVDGRQYFVGWENELAYWIGPRGGAPYPVVFAYSDGRLRPVNRGIEPILERHVAKAVESVHDSSLKPSSYGEFFELVTAAATELATRTVSAKPKSVLAKMRKTWSAPVMDFLEANKEAILFKPVCHAYAEPYRALPETPPGRDVTVNEPVWPESTKYLLNPQKW